MNQFHNSNIAEILQMITMSKKLDYKLSQEIYDLYDDYAHNKIDRRQFVESLSVYAVGGLTVPAILSHIMPNYTDKVQIQQDDPRLESQYISYDSPKGGGEIKGLLSTSFLNYFKFTVCVEKVGLLPSLSRPDEALLFE